MTIEPSLLLLALGLGLAAGFVAGFVGVGGGIIDDRPFKAVQTGGPSGGCIPAEHLDTPVTIDDVGRLGSMLGSGAVIVMDDTTNVVAAAHRIVRFYAHESCGQCTPCREGTTWLERIFDRILSGRGRRGLSFGSSASPSPPAPRRTVGVSKGRPKSRR